MMSRTSIWPITPKIMASVKAIPEYSKPIIPTKASNNIIHNNLESKEYAQVYLPNFKKKP